MRGYRWNADMLNLILRRPSGQHALHHAHVHSGLHISYIIF